VEFTGTATAAFSASHTVKGDPRCGRKHGHRWRVVVEIKVGQDPVTGELIDLSKLAGSVEQFCAEMHREDVNDMLPAGQPTAAGVALAVRERLAMTFRTIVSVTVWMDDEAAATLHA
jgi:6-pyruvoyl-tetrahydropterin synthase